jgi:hypothetical protein
MSINRANFVSNLLYNSFWKPENDASMIIGIQLHNTTPYTNFDYPYQLLFSFFGPGYYYLADRTQDKGGVSLNGTISYQYGSKNGKFLDKDTILWDGNIKWKRITPPENTQSDRYSPDAILKQDKQYTTTLYNQMNKAYFPSNT